MDASVPGRPPGGSGPAPEQRPYVRRIKHACPCPVLSRPPRADADLRAHRRGREPVGRGGPAGRRPSRPSAAGSRPWSGRSGCRCSSVPTHAMKLTEDGERCFARAKELLAGWRGVRGRPARRGRRSRKATLRVDGAARLRPAECSSRRSSRTCARHPRVNVEWLLRDRHAELHHRGHRLRASTVGQSPIPRSWRSSSRRCPASWSPAPVARGKGCPDAHPPVQTLGDAAVARAAHLLSHRGATDPRRRPARPTAWALRPRMSTDSLYALRNAALAGAGVCIASAWLLHDDARPAAGWCIAGAGLARRPAAGVPRLPARPLLPRAAAAVRGSDAVDDGGSGRPGLKGRRPVARVPPQGRRQRGVHRGRGSECGGRGVAVCPPGEAPRAPGRAFERGRCCDAAAGPRPAAPTARW